MSYLGNQPATGENNSFKILDDITSYTLTFDGASASIVSVADDTITKYEHRFITGQRVTYTHGGGTAIGGLTSGSVYYIVKNDQNTIKLAPSYADAIGSTNLINLSGLGVGTSHTLNVAFDGVNTKFKATYDNGTKAGITRAAQLQISINGVIQRPFDSVTPASGFGFDLDSVIVFSTAPASTDVFWGNLVANNFPTFDIADNDIDNFTGDAVTTSFTLSKTPANSQNILVTLDGVVQYPSDNDTTRAYTLSENVLTFDSAPGNGVFIQVRHIGFAGATSSEVTGFYGRTGNVALRHIDNVNVGNIDSVGFSTFTATGIGTVKIGIGNTALLVDGEARVTGILTVGNSSITLDGTTNKITIGSDDTFIQNGVIGIGTTNVENYALNVSGTANISGNTTIGGNANIKSLDYAGISSSISDTAVDIFVYDTSKDSDGGAWRKRTQHTSWYNETLNTATRGSRREFPAVAVIVAEATQVTIYDGDDPDLPIWMVFDRPTTSIATVLWAWSNVVPTGIVALNGIISFSTTGSSRFITLNFINEVNYIWDSSQSYKSNMPISKRNNGESNVSYRYAITGTILSRECNDVAMTVLPNAPIDSATGLPIPTIAVATVSGVSVIKDDGTVVDLTRSSGNQNTSYVDFNGDELIIQNSSTTGTYYNVAIPSSDTAHDDYNGDVFWAGGDPAAIKQYGASQLINSSPYTLVRGYDVGFNILTNYNLATKGLVAYAATSYNTGWMHGNIKGAFLSDTDTTNLVDTNLVSNGTFDTDTSGWSSSGSITVTQDSGRLKMVSGSGNPLVYTAVTCVVGKRYYFQADFEGSVSFHAGPNASSSGDVAYIPYGIYGSSTTRHCFFVATATTMYLVPHVIGTGNTGYVDNVICKLADHDRSIYGSVKQTVGGVNGISSGLATYGTVTKSAVATGAELVAYSDWSTSNYLQQPYNSDLDFGTGDWSIMAWIKTTRTSGYGDVVHRSDVGSTGYASMSDGSWFWQIFPNRTYGFYFRTAGGASTGVTISTALVSGVWTHVTIVRTGAFLRFYHNGILVSTSGPANHISASWSDSTSSMSLKMGWQGPSYSYPADQETLSLVRISKSAPSAEQIKKIYEDEKVLFQENAKCTLYGSSDAVTALAYDDKEELLHVGTSSGRSDFRGLRRINNTETAVTTAISAYDGLIAQQ